MEGCLKKQSSRRVLPSDWIRLLDMCLEMDAMGKNERKQTKREVLIAGTWYPCKSSTHHTESGWLSYTLRDGTNGLAGPKNWRETKVGVDDRR